MKIFVPTYNKYMAAYLSHNNGTGNNQSGRQYWGTWLCLAGSPFQFSKPQIL